MTILPNTILHADCFDVFPHIPDGSVDAIITDPPYFRTGLHFDKGTLDWDKLFSELLRVLKINGWFFMFGTLQMFKKASDYFREKFTYVWVKSNFVFSSQGSVRPYIKHEYIFGFINPQLKKVSELTFKRDELRTFGHEEYSRSENIRDGEWEQSIGAGGVVIPAKSNRTWRHGTTLLEAPLQQGYGHCTVKPMSIIETLLKGYTNENDLVLDPFLGSGTTAVACRNLRRNYIGIEKHEPYYNICMERIAKPHQDKLFI